MRQMNQPPLSEICAQMEGYLKLRMPKKLQTLTNFYKGFHITQALQFLVVLTLYIIYIISK